MQLKFIFVCQVFFLSCLFVKFQSIIVALLAFCSANNLSETFNVAAQTLCLGKIS